MSKSFREERSTRYHTEERLHNKQVKLQKRKLHEEETLVDDLDEDVEELLLHSNFDLSRL